MLAAPHTKYFMGYLALSLILHLGCCVHLPWQKLYLKNWLGQTLLCCALKLTQFMVFLPTGTHEGCILSIGLVIGMTQFL